MQGKEYAMVSATEMKCFCLKMMHVTFHWPGGSKSHATPNFKRTRKGTPAMSLEGGKPKFLVLMITKTIQTLGNLCLSQPVSLPTK